MGQKNTYGAESRGETLNFKPEDLKVITDPKHPLFDKRVEREPEESMIVSVMRNGVIVPMVIHRDGEDVYVVDGRQRRAAAIEANKRLAKAGGELILCPCVWKRGDEAKLYEIAVTTNALRTGDSFLETAHKMQHLADLGRDEDLLAVAFGCSVQTVKNHLAVLECAPAVQKWVEKGGSAVIAAKLSKLSKEEQVTTLEKMIAEGATKGAAADKAVKTKGKNVEPKAKTLSAKSRETIRTTFTNEFLKPLPAIDVIVAKAVSATLALVNGNKNALKEWPQVKALVEQVLAPKPKKEKKPKLTKEERKKAIKARAEDKQSDAAA
jgi:ParB family chromosome partitioning protein